MKKAVYFFCADPFDHVAGNVLQAVSGILAPREISLSVDDMPVLEYVDGEGSVFLFVRTKKVVSHDYVRYLPVMQELFSD